MFQGKLSSLETRLTTLIGTKVQEIFDTTLDNTIKTKIQENITSENEAAVNKLIQEKYNTIIPDFEKLQASFTTDCNTIIRDKNTEMETKVNTATTNGTNTLNGKVSAHLTSLDGHAKKKLEELDDKTVAGASDIKSELTSEMATLKTLVNEYNISSTKPHPFFPNVNAASILNEPQQTLPPNPVPPSPTSTTSSTAFNISGFHKHFNSCMDAPIHIINFYQQLHTQGQLYGIHCIALNLVAPYIDLCPSHFNVTERTGMATTLYQKLQKSRLCHEEFPSSSQHHHYVRRIL